MQIPRYWRDIDERYNLTGRICGHCDHVFFPKRSLCPKCRHHSVGKLKEQVFSGKGNVVSWTRVHNAPDEFASEAPYILAIVELAEGPRVTTQLVDMAPDEVTMGMPVEARFRKLGSSPGAGVVHYGYKFGPLTG